MREAFASNLKTIRETRGISQADLAINLGVSRVSIGYYEKGERVPDIETLNKLCDYFEVSSDYMLGRTTNPSTNIEEQAITNRLGLSGLSISILEQVNSYSDELATILNILIEQEFAYRVIWADTLEKYPSSFTKHRSKVFGDIDKQINEEIKKHPDLEERKSDYADTVKASMINKWAENYYVPILSRIYHYLVEYKPTNNETCYISPEGKVNYEDPLKNQIKEKDIFKNDIPKRIPFKSHELIEYALTMDIQDSIRILKNMRAGVLGDDLK